MVVSIRETIAGLCLESNKNSFVVVWSQIETSCCLMGNIATIVVRRGMKAAVVWENKIMVVWKDMGLYLSTVSSKRYSLSDDT